MAKHLGVLLLSLSLSFSKSINPFQEIKNEIIEHLSKNGSIENPFRRGLLATGSSCADGSTCSSSTTCGDGSSCRFPFTSDEIKLILDIHNARRDKAASGNEDCYGSKCPSGTDMNYLFWDPGLAAVAADYAFTCPSGHHDTASLKAKYKAQCDKTPSNCKAENYDSEWIGENMASSSATGEAAMKNGIKGWYDESSRYKWSDKAGVETGHWTQGVWARTRYVGCGYSICAGTFKFRLVCNYYPGGNSGDGYPYSSGTKCSDCESDRIGCTSSMSSDSSYTSNNALCGGPQCSTCAQQVASSGSTQACDKTPTTCPGTSICKDGTEGPAMTPTQRQMSICTPQPTPPTQPPTKAPNTPTVPPAVCSITLSNLAKFFGSVDLNGEYTYKGLHNGVPYYERTDSAYYIFRRPAWYNRYVIHTAVDDVSNYLNGWCNNDAETDVTNCGANKWTVYDGSGWAVDSDAVASCKTAAYVNINNMDDVDNMHKPQVVQVNIYVFVLLLIVGAVLLICNVYVLTKKNKKGSGTHDFYESDSDSYY